MAFPPEMFTIPWTSPPEMITIPWTSDNDTHNNNSTEMAVRIIVSLIILAVIAAVSCYCAKKVRRAIISDIQEAVTPPQQQQQMPSPNYTFQVWEVDTPTMERFLRELAEEKPVRFSPQQLCTFTANYSTVLGSGGFGKVYKGQFPNGVKIAVKILNRIGRGADKTVEEQFMAEVGSIGRTHHINLVRLYGFCYDQFMSALVYEFMENGSLDRHLFGAARELDWAKLRKIAVETARGIAYLHHGCQKRIIHYDIKPGNVLLDANFSPKVADFGLAKLCNIDDTHVTVSGFRGTPGYLAPEFMLNNYPITYKCDVYSFGILLFEIVGRRKNSRLSGSSVDSLDWFPKQVWEEYEKGKLLALIESSGVGEKDRGEAETMAMVALWCVQDSPDARPPMSAVVQMLEGGVEIMPPPKPFQYLFRLALDVSGSESENSAGNGRNSCWYKETTPIMAKYEITVASFK